MRDHLAGMYRVKISFREGRFTKSAHKKYIHTKYLTPIRTCLMMILWARGCVDLFCVRYQEKRL